MDKTGNQLSLSKRSVKSIGHEFTERITDDAANRVCYQLELAAQDVFRDAQLFANHAGRMTVKEEDILLALKVRDFEPVGSVENINEGRD